MLGKLSLHKGQGKARAEKAYPLELRNNPWQSTDMVFMTMCQDNSAKPVTYTAHSLEIGDNHVNAQMFIAGKHQAAVDHNDTCGRLPQLTIESDFPHAPKGGQRQKRCLSCSLHHVLHYKRITSGCSSPMATKSCATAVR